MSKTIVMVPTGEGSLFIYGMKSKGDILSIVYRTSKNIEFLQEEIVKIHNGMLLFSFYNVPLVWSEKFPVLEGKAIGA